MKEDAKIAATWGIIAIAAIMLMYFVNLFVNG